ncbi:MAG: O-antigen ligase family protein [Acidobacteriota bacterium]
MKRCLSLVLFTALPDPVSGKYDSTRRTGGADPATPMKKYHPLLILAILFLEVLLPGRWFPASGLVQAGLLAIAGAILFRDLSGARWSRPALLALLAGLAAIAANLALAMQTHQAVLVVCRLFQYTTIFLFAGFSLTGRQSRTVLRGFALLGCIAAIWGILQAAGGFREALALLEVIDLPSEDLLAARLQSGRVFGPFILPSLFGSFLILAIPVSASFLFRPIAVPEKVLWSATLGIELWALYATGSHGAILALLAALLVVAFFRLRGRYRWTMVATAVILMMILAAVVQSRQGVILDPANPTGPIGQRLGVWESAVSMIADRPLFGVGGGCFGIAFPPHRPPGIHDTRYAHNSYLQVVAEYGIWTVVPLFLFSAGYLRRIRRGFEGNPTDWRRDLLWVGVTAFLVHNLVDFGMLIAATGIPFLILLGVIYGTPRLEPARKDPRPSAVPAGVRGMPLMAALITMLLAALLMVSDHHLGRGLELIGKGNRQEAIVRMEKAVAIYPFRPEPWGILATVLYRPQSPSAAELQRARDLALRAVELDPHQSFRYELLGMIDFALGHDAPAYLEFRRADRLHPGRERYGQALETVRERVLNTDETRH